MRIKHFPIPLEKLVESSPTGIAFERPFKEGLMAEGQFLVFGEEGILSNRDRKQA